MKFQVLHNYQSEYITNAVFIQNCRIVIYSVVNVKRKTILKTRIGFQNLKLFIISLKTFIPTRSTLYNVLGGWGFVDYVLIKSRISELSSTV